MGCICDETNHRKIILKVVRQFFLYNFVNHAGTGCTEKNGVAVGFGAYSILGANDAGYACGCVVTHNLIHDSPHAAVLYGGNDHRFEFNEVHDFLVESDDLGGFYTNNGWCSYGNLVRYNFIHHTSHALGIYLDDADSGDTLEGNIMYRMGTGAAVGGGHDNILRQNVAIECPGGFGIDARGVSRKYDQDSGMLRDYQKLNPVNPPWSTRFPTLPNLLENNPAMPNGCVLERNIVTGTAKAADLRGKPEHFKGVTLKDNAALTPEDLRLKDLAKLDFRMAADAPAFAPALGRARPGRPVLRLRRRERRAARRLRGGQSLDAARGRLHQDGRGRPADGCPLLL